MFKKIVLFSVLVLALSGCMGVPETLIPEEVYQESEPSFNVPAIAEYKSPSGSYILIRVSSAGTPGFQNVAVDLFFNGHKVCSWEDYGNDMPWDREDQTLYFAPIEGNCPEMDSRNGVVWHVFNNYGEVIFNEEVIQEIPVWSLVGSQFFLQPKK